jgi:hypothetical protein
MLANLLAHRTRSLRNANDFLPKKINDTLHFLARHSSIIDENTREQYACILCKAVARNGIVALKALQHGPPENWMNYSDHEDIIAAVALIGNTKLIKNVLSVVSGELKEDRRLVGHAYEASVGYVFGNAVAHTLYQREIVNVKLILDHIRANVDRNGPAWSTREGHFSPLNNFIRDMIQEQNISRLKFLLKWQNSQLPDVAKPRFNEWVVEALDTRKNDNYRRRSQCQGCRTTT